MEYVLPVNFFIFLYRDVISKVYYVIIDDVLYKDSQDRIY